MNGELRDKFLAPVELAREPVEVPGLGVTVFVRVMTIGEMERFEAARSAAPPGSLQALMVAYTACDEAGDLLFTEADVPALAARPVGSLTKVVDAALKLNTLSAEAVDAAEKNSGTAPSSPT